MRSRRIGEMVPAMAGAALKTAMSAKKRMRTPDQSGQRTVVNRTKSLAQRGRRGESQDAGRVGLRVVESGLFFEVVVGVRALPVGNAVVGQLDRDARRAVGAREIPGRGIDRDLDHR